MSSSYHSYSLDKTTNTIVTDNSLNFLYDPKKHPPVSIKEIVTSLFNQTTLIIFIGFLAIYFILFFILGGFYGHLASSKILKTQSINFTILGLIIFGGLYFYYSLPKADQNDFIRYVMLLFQDEMNDPNTIFIMMEFLILFYIFVFLFGFSMTKEDKAFSLHIIELKSWIYLVMLIFICFFIYVLNIEIVDLVYFEFYRILDSWKNLYGDNDDVVTKAAAVIKKSSPVAASPSPAAVVVSAAAGGQEVFNVSSNQYTYDDAQAICKAYGARLAKYDEIEQAYEAGAEWCNYGWSDGQMAYFPTQKSTWDTLQKDPSKQHNCGRPGINGGYINNPAIKFGVNCYGVKPPPNEMEKNMLNSTLSQTVVSSPAAAAVIDTTVEKWKQQLDSLSVNSYNRKEWSQYS